MYYLILLQADFSPVLVENGANIKLDEDGNIITDEDATLYVDFPTASLMTDGDIFSVTNSYLIAKIIGDVAELNKKAWIYSML